MGRYLILFIHDGRPAVRVVRGSEENAEALSRMVSEIYDTPARFVEEHADHDDTEQIEADFKEVLR